MRSRFRVRNYSAHVMIDAYTRRAFSISALKKPLSVLSLNMAFQFLTNYLHSLISYFRIDVSNDRESSDGSQVDECLNISPAGSSVDPETFSAVTFSSQEELCSGNESGAYKDVSAANRMEDASGERCPTAPLCTDQDIPAIVNSHAQPANDSKAKTLDVQRGCTERGQSTDSGSPSESKDASKKQQLLRECSKPNWTPPSTDGDNSGVCALYRLCPQLAPGAVIAKPAWAASRVRGRLTFNSPLFSEGDFELRVLHNKVCLEFVQVDAEKMHGYIRVLNTACEKDVTVYYTESEWKMVHTTKAKWVESVSGGRMDRFAFTIPGRESEGDIMFSLTFNGISDNNKGNNYTVTYEHCRPRVSSRSCLTAPLCTNQGIPVTANSYTQPAKDCKAKTLDVLRGCCTEREKSTESGSPSGSFTKHKDGCQKKLLQLLSKCSKPNWTPPSNDDDNSGVCALYRLCPQLAPGAVIAKHAQAASRVRGRLTFNSPLFSEGDFELRVLHNKVCLEFVQVDAEEIHGYIRILNAAYEKDVTVYYTESEWKMVHTTKAKWVESVSGGRMDRFAFTIPGRVSEGDIMFSLTFNGISDNNKGNNYTVTYEHY